MDFEDTEGYTELEKSLKAEQEAYKRGRAEAIEQIRQQMTSFRDAHKYTYKDRRVQIYADGFRSGIQHMISIVDESIGEAT